jgi:hypothetical protein
MSTSSTTWIGSPLPVSGNWLSKWVTVTILVYVNLINYMDRLTIAGKMKITLYIWDTGYSHHLCLVTTIDGKLIIR